MSYGKSLIIACIFNFSLLLTSCEDFVDIDPPNTEIIRQDVFERNQTAIDAVKGIYYEMINGGWASGGFGSVTYLTGFLADELDSYSDNNEFYNNSIQVDNSEVKGLWDDIYNTIYLANAVIEGVQNSEQMAEQIKGQLEGEAKFIRAFAHFHLVNLFGEVPVITTTDYRVNNVVSRNTVGKVYDQIITDLQEAQALLSEDYQFSNNEKIVPNRATATALLARVYLFNGNWSSAEQQATLVIDNANYGLETDLDSVFLANSLEAIWQLQPTSSGGNTFEGTVFINTGEPCCQALTNDFLGSFEANDNRFTDWVGNSTDGSTIWSHSFKYKIRSGNPGIEYSMVLRVAEQYLIRAEANAQQNELMGAMADLDVIRGRAGLPLIQDTNPTISQADILLAIEQERRVELFTEWGQRWFDLKRTGRANTVLSVLKEGWQPTDVLLPVPEVDIEINGNLLPQNSGY